MTPSDPHRRHGRGRGRQNKADAGRGPDAAPTARGVAVEVLTRIDDDDAYANLALGAALDRSGLDGQDRGFATDLVYGTTRMRRSLDVSIDRFVDIDPDPPTRRLLRLGAYQLMFGGVAPHAAVGETVQLAPRRTRGFVNAVLRRIADHPEPTYPSPAAQLSYPEWLYQRLIDEAGADDGVGAMERMNTPPPVTTRADGYVQDLASQWVAAAVEGTTGERVLDMCAAPGGKATAIAGRGADVVAADRSPARAGLIVSNADRVGVSLATVVADGTAPPFGDAAFDAVLLDAPCSGLGALRRRPDARWRISSESVDDLAGLQSHLLESAANLVAVGGRLVYSVCTITAAESIDHPTPPGFEVDDQPPPEGIWRRFGHGWRVLPHDADTDGMVLIRYRRVR